MTRIIDISPLVSPQIGVWPGDVPYLAEKSLRMTEGANLDLGAMRTTYHVGAHTDAPQHYEAGGADIASVALDPYYGLCQVIEVAAKRGERFGVDALHGDVTEERVLLRTGTFPDPTDWNEDFAAPESALIDHLGALGVRLVGFDTPSTDLFDSKGLPAHKALAANQMVNLEGLVLDHVRPGRYTLCAFPLRLADADASPVRAVLLQD